ncbi:hypothetical protein BCR34DRAFT_41984 [Clohesyomyces aquaticus]|uniref:Uncharacterized protein n=1 Tax=Clohesyomyces aquaticus TaxID=1231657 RepID=A0A1Y1Z6N1_9PLEO|nr:hypothetical protein BCR34DRAFT_41984 [Clohesyomyces aquaticus]
MASTTLVTFMFDCPAAVRTVELLGSWDNFSKSYRLRLDKRRGPNIWSGCYSFEDIICDGDLTTTGEKRNGALKMGGTYWYYYKVDDDDEHHNPSQPSTTVCPLLPGQRLNVLEVPTETRGRSDSSSSTTAVFTRNPNDKYLNPVPPKAVPSRRPGNLCTEAYSVPMHPYGEPRSATFHSRMRSLSPGWERQPRNASTSPNLPSNAVFSDLRGLKDRFTHSRRAASDGRGRCTRPKNVKDLHIGAPTLLSTTAEDVNLVALPSRPTPKVSLSLPSPVKQRMKGFSPLGSHPVDPVQGFDFGFSSVVADRQGLHKSRRSSQLPAVVVAELSSTPTRARANSSETRRTKHYVCPNAPLLSSPVVDHGKESEEAIEEELNEFPILQQPPMLLQPTCPEDGRPTSSRGGDHGLGLRQSRLLGKDKDLPALPRYLVPAPLFACNGSTNPVLPNEEVTQGPYANPLSESRSHFSIWSTESELFDSPTSDGDGIHSPTFSSLTSESGELDTPQRFSDPFFHGEQAYPKTLEPTVPEPAEQENDVTQSSPLRIEFNCDSPPVLHLDTPAFGETLFQLDVRTSGSGSRRQAACFGLSGFQGYSLSDETLSQGTITKVHPNSSVIPEASIGSEDGSSVSQSSRLLGEFGYLGAAVL